MNKPSLFELGLLALAVLSAPVVRAKETTIQDSDGRVKKIVYNDTPAPGMTETILIKGATWRHEIRRGETLVREELEVFDGDERLIRKSSTWSSHDNGILDRRAVERFPGLARQTTSFELVGGRWVNKGTVIDDETLVFGAGKRGGDPSDAYVACLKRMGAVGEGRNAESACRRQLKAVIDLSSTNFPAYAKLECRDDAGKQIFLPQGFRIDADSCAGDPFVEAVIRSSIAALESDIKCLDGVNGEIAKKLQRAIALRRPRINCLPGAQFEEGSPLERRLCGKLARTVSGNGGCMEKVTSLMDRKTGAFFNSATPNDIYLVRSSPSQKLAQMKYDVQRDVAEKAERQRLYGFDRDKLYEQTFQNRKKAALAAPSERLAATLLHELLHLAGIPHDDKLVSCGGKRTIQHNCYVNDGYLKDAVYGCQAVCGGETSYERWTKEGCRACVGWAPKGAKSRGDLSKCDQKPKASWE